MNPIILLCPNVEFQGSGLASSSEGLFTSLTAIGIIDHDLQFSWLILHIVPAEAVTVEALLRILGYLALALPIQE